MKALITISVGSGVLSPCGTQIFLSHTHALCFKKNFLQGLGEFVTFFQKLQNVCEEIADAKYESFMMGITF